MDALGLIETQGLLPAIESVDVMLKAAQVELLSRTLVGGGLVTVIVTGDVGAVQASVEAGAAAVEKLGKGLLISRHIIPRPHREIETIVLKPKAVVEPEPEAVVEPGPEAVVEPEPEAVVEPEPEAVVEPGPEAVVEPGPETVVEPGPEAVVEPGPEAVVEPGPEAVVEPEPEVKAEQKLIPAFDKQQLQALHKDDIDDLITQYGTEASLSLLNKSSVAALRRLVREYADITLKGREQSRATKATLLRALTKYYKETDIQK